MAKFEIVARILDAVPHAEFGSIASDVIAIAMGYFAVEAGSAAEDPPRSDYTTSTRAKRRSLPIEKLGESELERGSALFAEASSNGAAYLAAFVRAVERSQMAEEVKATQALALRVAEAETYAARATASIRQASEHGLLLAQALEGDEGLRQRARAQFSGPEADQLLATPYWEKLGPKAVRLFREARVDPKALASDWDPTWPEDPIQSSVITLRHAAESSNVFASELQNWGPETEKPATPAFWEV